MAGAAVAATVEDPLYYHSIPVLQLIQRSLAPVQDGLFALSHVADPANIVCLLIPALYNLKPSFGVKMLWAINIAEWCNLMLKWTLRGHRPYWWVHETALFPDGTRPHLVQFPGTCETGSGSPSGHAMAMGSTMFVFVSVCLAELSKKVDNPRVMAAVRCGAWLAYVALLLCIDVSRLYLATHFPHQAVLGNILGALVGYCVLKFWKRLQGDFLHHMGSVCLVTASTVTLYLLLTTAFNPNWSVEMAKKRCLLPEWVKVSTTPFYTLVRVAGGLFGLALAVALNCSLRQTQLCHGMPWRVRLVSLPLTICAVRLVEDCPVRTQNVTFFLALAFLKIAVVTFMLVAAVPNAVDAVIGRKAAHGAVEDRPWRKPVVVTTSNGRRVSINHNNNEEALLDSIKRCE